jgi:hypothetical protein
MLKYILKKYGEWMWIASVWLRTGQMFSCGRVNELSVPTKAGISLQDERLLVSQRGI